MEPLSLLPHRHPCHIQVGRIGRYGMVLFDCWLSTSCRPFDPPCWRVSLDHDCALRARGDPRVLAITMIDATAQKQGCHHLQQSSLTKTVTDD